jgi:transcriptional regulator GlxA family with amidase domain
MVTTRRLRVVCCLFEGFATLDVSLFHSVLALAGQRWNHRAFELTLGAASAGLVPGFPHPLSATHSLAELEPADVLFVPGGSGAKRAAEDEGWGKRLRELAQGASAIVTCGSGQFVLARSGLLAESAAVATGPLAEELKLALGSEVISDAEYVVDGALHVASSSLSLLPVALELVRATLGRSEADAVAGALGQRQPALLLRIKP